jgi:hypothetical protein
VCRRAPGARSLPPTPRLARCVGGVVSCLAARCCLCTRLQQTHVPAEGQQPRYPGRVHGLGTRGRNRAHHPRVCVSCSPWAILSRLTIFLAVINRWGLLHACTCATHICNTHALDFMGTHFCRVTHPLGDNRGCIELSCPTFSDRTGCQCGQLAELLQVSREKPCMRGQGISGAHGPHLLRAPPSRPTSGPKDRACC